ncbi:MAG: thiamine pyrophosphate-dependent enzyme [candidate division KSB1 bacterium]|nr:thiamine pyrophosphate-dependent enzyme [candidate division KSB1 bacterium]
MAIQSKPRARKAKKAAASSQFDKSVILTELYQTLFQIVPAAAGALLQKLQELLPQKSARLSVAALRKFEGQFLQKVPDVLDSVPAAWRKKEIVPMMTAAEARERFLQKLHAGLAAAFERLRLRASLTPQEKIEILRGMLRTRYLDARLKKFFASNEVKLPDGAPFQGKGFRSMGQEAIYAAGIRLRRGERYRKNGQYTGDIIAPMIRDLGLALAMGLEPYDVMAAQMGKPGKPTQGKDLHIGDFDIGVLPPAAPITISTGTTCGIGLALKGTGRVVINCNGEGATSAGEWHEAINFAAVQRIPIVYVLQNNQTALSTPINEQFACDRLAERAEGYGIRGITIDGTDPEAVFAAVTEAAEACRRGEGPVIVELLCMRMCGHAHHDDMLYFGHEPDQYLEYPDIREGGYVDPEKYAYWREKDPIARYREQLLQEKVLTPGEYEQMVAEVEAEIEEAANRIKLAKWPPVSLAGHPVFTDGAPAVHVDPLENRTSIFPDIPDWHSDEPVGFTADPKGKTFWQAIVEALEEEMRRDPSVFILGEDVGGQYGNAFVILKSLLDEFGDRFLNTPLAEAAIIGAATGAALMGKRPVAEIQFNDFVASGFNQLVNNTAKIYYRWHQPVPLTIRMPWGGLRQAGPYHSQNTEPWFYRTPGLKIVCPSTPREAKALLKAAIRDDNPVLFYEHVALYRAANIKEHLPSAEEDVVLPLGRAHLKRDGSDLTIITYGAYVHRCLEAARQLEAAGGVQCLVLDLRSIQPMDQQAILWSVKKTGKVLIVQEDSKTGGIGQSVAAIIAEEAFEYLDGPVRVLGALDSPVPYSPPLEERFLVSTEQIEQAARRLLNY